MKFGPICGASVILEMSLCGLKIASNSFHKYFWDFLKALKFTPSRADQDIWIWKSENYEGYYYIGTHVDDVIIAAKNKPKYLHDIERNFKVRDINDFPR